MELKPNKAPGLDSLRAETVNECVKHLAAPLVYIFNKSLISGAFPKAFKTAIIKSIFKSGDRLDLQNYKPISLLSCLSKIYEKIIIKRILSYLNKCHILSNNQYGFWEGRLKMHWLK